MIRFNEAIAKQSKSLLENQQQALWCAIVFAVLPFVGWLSVALVALVTLRKGAKSGFDLLLPALVIHSVPLMMLAPIQSALVDTFITYVPCYIAAIGLRKTMSWQWVFGVILMQAGFSALIFQWCAPDFILDQFKQLMQLMSTYQDFQNLIPLKGDVWAQLLFGAELLSVVITAVLCLGFARAIQAKLFMPGGFKDELLAFRSGKIALLVLGCVALGSYYRLPTALNLLPLLICYFIAAGFNLAYFILARKRHAMVAVLLGLLILLKPSYVLFGYLIMGSLDSLFNFRLYLPSRAREST